MPSPHAVAALAFVHTEFSILGSIKHGNNERRFFTAFAATWGLWPGGGACVFHFMVLAPAHEITKNLSHNGVVVYPVTDSSRPLADSKQATVQRS